MTASPARTARRTAAPPAVDSVRVAVARSTLGLVLVAQGEAGVRAVLIGDDEAELRADLAARLPRATLQAADAATEALARRVVALVERPGAPLADALDARGTAFQRRVWEELARIPAGETVTYAGLAARVGAPGSARAVAGACAANPLAVVVPCHRVLRGDGGLSGYRWGVERKRALLDREAGVAR